METQTYQVRTNWIEDRVGSAQAPGLETPLTFSAPPEFGGQPGLWSPELLLVAAASSCFLSTLLYLADRNRLTLAGYRDQAEGRLERVPDHGYRFAELTLYSTVLVEKEEDLERAERLLEKAKRLCIVSNSLAVPLRVEAQVEVRTEVLNRSGRRG